MRSIIGPQKSLNQQWKHIKPSKLSCREWTSKAAQQKKAEETGEGTEERNKKGLSSSSSAFVRLRVAITPLPALLSVYRFKWAGNEWFESLISVERARGVAHVHGENWWSVYTLLRANELKTLSTHTRRTLSSLRHMSASGEGKRRRRKKRKKGTERDKPIQCRAR